MTLDRHTRTRRLFVKWDGQPRGGPLNLAATITFDLCAAQILGTVDKENH